MDNYTVKEGKTIAIISYITWIGTIIAFLMNNDKRNYFASFHIRQSMGLAILSLLNSFVIIKFFDFWTLGIISLSIFILRIVGLVGAIQGEEKRIPLFGDAFQDWFKNIA
jgi:uncharacterized membrane protein